MSGKIATPIAVASRSFSKHPLLREKLLETFSNVRFNDQGLSLGGSALVDFLKGSVGAIIALEKVNDDILRDLPDLKFISKYGVGLDNLDQEAMKHRGVALGWTGGVNRRGVAELALSFMMGILRHVFISSRKVAEGDWKNIQGLQLTGKTVGVIGCGHIGKDLIRLLAPFECNVLVNDILPMQDFCAKVGARQIDKEALLKQADVVTLHVPYGETTHHLISRKELALMKSTAVLVNTSRGNIVDEDALFEALKAEKIRGAGMDVFAIEPPVSCPLLKLPNFVGTPHIGGSSEEAVYAMGAAAIANLSELMAGSTPNG